MPTSAAGRQLSSRAGGGRSGTGSCRSDARHPPMAEVRVREASLQQQQRLCQDRVRLNRDRSTFDRDFEKRERRVLMELARLLDSQLTPSIDDWFAKRRVPQASRQAGSWYYRRGGDCGDRSFTPAGDGEVSDLKVDDREEAADQMLDRQRVLEMKSKDWCGFTSIPSKKHQPHEHHQGPGESSNTAPPELGGAALTPRQQRQKQLQRHHHHNHRVQSVPSRPKTAGARF
uniref:Homeobox domain-containing protein n=1 Tax=Macrostomum lignano TaxID=282301 RepID=A0A1I8IV31_9PLAT